jgi:hypothetical protein
MICYPICAVAAVFLVSMLYVTFMVDKNYVNSTIMSDLSPQLKQEYLKRVTERRNIHMTGFVGGLVIALIILFILRQTVQFGSMSSACVLIVVTYVVSLTYYYLTPKLPLFVTLLNKQSDRENWEKIYKYMKYNYIMSFVFGVFFVGLLGYGLCN